jgi:outer membrane protein
MKKIALLLLLSFASVSQAIEIATLDMNHVFENYFRTIIENEKLGKQKDIVQSTLKGLNEKVYKLQSDYQQLMRDSMNPGLTEEARLRKKEEAEAMATQGQTALNNLKMFQKETQQKAAAQRKTRTTALTDEIQKAVDKYAKENKLDLIIDESGKSINGINNLIFSNPALSITDDILKIVNLGQEEFVAEKLAARQAAAVEATKK